MQNKSKKSLMFDYQNYITISISMVLVIGGEHVKIYKPEKKYILSIQVALLKLDSHQRFLKNTLCKYHIHNNHNLLNQKATVKTFDCLKECGDKNKII